MKQSAFLKKGIPAVAVCLAFALTLAGCDNPSSPADRYDNFVVTFNSAGGSAVAAAQVQSGSVVTRPGNPARAGYTFAEWYTDDTFTTRFDFASPIVANIILHARWDINTFIVDFSIHGGLWTEARQTVSWNATATRPVPDPARAGFIFDDWFTAAQGGTVFNFDEMTITQNIIVHARFETAVTVTFNTGGGTPVPANQIIRRMGAATRPETDPVRPGYVFVNWYTHATGGTVFNFATTAITQNMTLHARYQRLHTVTFNTNGGTPAPAAQMVANGAFATRPETDPSKPGSNFVEWFTHATGGTWFNFGGTAITQDRTVYAIYSYTVTFNTNGGTPVPPTQTVFHMALAIRPVSPTRPGFTFDGWYTDAELITAYNFAAPITSSITLFARWIPSVTGVTWSEVSNSTFPTGSLDLINDVAWGNGRFVAVGGGGRMAHSVDGITWTAVGNSTFGGFGVNSVAWGNGRFVAVGGGGRMAHSADGITWTAVANSAFGTGNIIGVGWGNGRFIAVGSVGSMAYSDDGITWTAVTSLPFTWGTSAVAWGHDRFVTVANGGEIGHSTNGVTWTLVANSTFGTGNISSVAWGNGRFVAGGAGGRMAYSVDGITWMAVQDSAFGSSWIYDIVWGNGKFVAVGDSGIAYSADGITWNAAARPPFPFGSFRGVAYGNNRFVAVGQGGRIAFSGGN